MTDTSAELLLGRPALDGAVMAGDEAAMSAVLAQGESPNRTFHWNGVKQSALSHALLAGHHAVAMALIEAGAHPYRAFDEWNTTRVKVRSPVMAAMEVNDRQAFERLLEKHPELNQPEATAQGMDDRSSLWGELVRHARVDWLAGILERKRREEPAFHLTLKQANCVVRSAGKRPSVAALELLAEHVSLPMAFVEETAAWSTYGAFLDSQSTHLSRHAHTVAHWALQRGATLEGLHVHGATNSRKPSSALAHLVALTHGPKHSAVAHWAERRSAEAPLEELDRAIAWSGTSHNTVAFRILTGIRMTRPDADAPFTADGDGTDKPWAFRVVADRSSIDQEPLLAFAKAWAECPLGCRARDAAGRSVLEHVLRVHADRNDLLGSKADDYLPFVEAVCSLLVNQGCTPLECPVPLADGKKTTLELLRKWAPAAHAQWQARELEHTTSASAGTSAASRRRL